MFNRLQSPAVSRCCSPFVAPLPAVDEATLTASPTQKLQNHSQHDPSHKSYLHSPCTTPPSPSITSIVPAPLPPQLSHPALKVGARHTSLRSRCLTNWSDPQLRHPHPKVGAYHYLFSISPHPPSPHCNAPLRGNDVQRLRYAHATSYSCPRYPMHIPGRF